MRSYVYRCEKCRAVAFSRKKIPGGICHDECGGALEYEGPTTERTTPPDPPRPPNPKSEPSDATISRLAASLRREAEEHGKAARGASWEHHARVQTDLGDAASLLDSLLALRSGEALRKPTSEETLDWARAHTTDASMLAQAGPYRQCPACQAYCDCPRRERAQCTCGFAVYIKQLEASYERLQEAYGINASEARKLRKVAEAARAVVRGRIPAVSAEFEGSDWKHSRISDSLTDKLAAALDALEHKSDAVGEK